MNLRKIQKLSLTVAESFDSWRIIPRIMLIAYGALVVNLYAWFRDIPTFIQQKCDPAVLQIFIQAGKSIADAQSLACSVSDVVGGPTAAQSAFVTTIIGLSAGIFGLYTATGRHWESFDPNEYDTQSSDCVMAAAAHPPTKTPAAITAEQSQPVSPDSSNVNS